MRAPVALLFLSVLAGGCHNSCQKICKEMLAYAEECGLEVTKDDLSDCLDSQAGVE